MKEFSLLILALFFYLLNVGQNEKPVAVNDTLDGGTCGDTLYLEVLSNDYHPAGKEFVIKSTRPSLTNFVKVEIAGDQLRYIHPLFPVNMEMDTIYYTLSDKDDPEITSNEAKVFIHLQQLPDRPECNPDSTTVLAGWHTVIDVLANDDLKDVSPEHLFLQMDYFLGIHTTFDVFVDYTAFMASSGQASGRYMITDLETYGAVSGLEIDVTSNNSYDSLDINNINAGIHSDGYLFSSYNEIIDRHIDDYVPHFEYPAGSGKNTIFSSALWIGGKDQNDSLHLAAQRYKQVGWDFQLGPVSNDYEGQEYFKKWSRLWKVSKEEVSYHRNNYWKEDYVPVEAIIQWPGNGDTENGQALMLAPFADTDGDELYEPMQGDYPLIRGDQTIFYIFNDDRWHSETQGAAMKVEIHGMAYAFNASEDTVLNNTVFVHMDLYNRSENTYTDTYLGYFTDLEIGYAWDDFVGSHVQWGSFYGYNGLEVDGNGEPDAYGNKPPAQSVTVLAGPFMDEDDNDNPSGQCDYGLNGLNFGDGVIDNERMGMTRFVKYLKGAFPWGSPNIQTEYYTYMEGFWKDGSPILYGEDGIPPYADGPACRFMFPGDSDTCNWGTGGEYPNGGYNQNGKYWTESEVGHVPGDRWGLGVSGPFTFKPGDVQEVELAFCLGQGENRDQSTKQLFANLEDLFTRVRNGEIIVPNEILDIAETGSQPGQLNVFPNPASETITVRLPQSIHRNEARYQIYNSSGMVVQAGILQSLPAISIPVSHLKKGFYILVIEQSGQANFGKFVKR
jgi:hypothetical protein